jgi:hypothetical protein
MAAVRLRVRGPGGGAVLNGVRSDWSLQQLKALIESELGVPAVQQGLRAGFPPSAIPDAAGTLAELGIADGDTLVVEDKGPGAAAAPAPAPPAAAAAAAAPAAAAASVPAAADPAALQQLAAMGFSAEQAAGALEAASGNLEAAVQILLGGGGDSPPPRPAAPQQASAAAGGGEAAQHSAAAAAAEQRSRAYPSKGAAVVGAGGSLHRRVVPADNSCLFNSVAYVCEGDRQLSAAVRLRKLVADTVLADPAQYSEAFLGKPTQAYADWICGSDHWGGAIELSILCQHYKTVISCVCIQTLRVDHYGEGNGWGNRVLLIYDGLHYDALALEGDGLLDAVFSCLTSFIWFDRFVL